MRKRRKIIRVVILIMLAACGISLYLSNYALMTTHYTLASDKIGESFRIVHLTDLHNSIFGNHNERLVQKIRQESPDLICITGDLINSDEKDVSIAVDLIENLTNIASVYCSYGNHEKAYEKLYNVDLKAAYEKAGAVVLEYDYIDILVKGNSVRLGGIYGYCLPAVHQVYGGIYTEEYQYLSEFQESPSDTYKVLLCHLPLCWNQSGSLEDYEIDCVLAGHTHGGQIILPLIGGIYAPDRGYFIGREWGVYNSLDGKRHLVLSRGLGSNEKIPRFNNIPEIVVIDYKSKGPVK